MDKEQKTDRRGFLKTSTLMITSGAITFSWISLLPQSLWALKLGREKPESEPSLFTPLTKKERCPVCGMFVSPYPKWITQIQFKDGSHYSFDGMKCFCRFYFQPQSFDSQKRKEDFKTLLVRDYYTLKFIPYDEAFYVVGSDVLGPMGHELIPFAEEETAKIFLNDHHGQKILRFSDITEPLLDLLDQAKKNVVLD